MVALSKARAAAVSTWLANHGVDPSRILPVGCGSNRPIKGPGGAIDHDASKRTEVYVISEKGKALAGPAVPPDCEQ